MENAALAESWVNRPHKIYGFKLRPFSLYHLHLLQAIGSPLVQAGAPFSAVQLFLAAEICSSPWSEEGYTLDRLLRPSWLRKTRNRFRLMTRSFRSQEARWREYYGDYLTVAEKWDVVKSKDCAPPRNDLERVLATATSVIYGSHWPEEKVMMMPIGRAFAWADYFGIQQGAQIHFMSEQEKEMMAADMEARKREAAEQEKADAPAAP